MQSNAFDEVLDLEERFYNDGFQQGQADGIKAGRIEGRTFGLEQGFEKYGESARLYGKSIVWANRMPQSGKMRSDSNRSQNETGTGSTSETEAPQRQALPPLSDNSRLAKHVKVLYALSESESLSTENTEEAVSDFDDRLKRAKGKAKIIERIVGEIKSENDDIPTATGGDPSSMEDVKIPQHLA